MDSPRAPSYYTGLLNSETIVDDSLSNEFSQWSHPSQVSYVPDTMFEIPTTTEQKSKKIPRLKIFSSQEDSLLISAWLNTSMDPVHGNQQKLDAFWKRITEYYHENKEFISERNQNSLMHRWSGIQLEVNKFCGYYAQIQNNYQSGVTEQDKILQALEMYKELQRKSFQYLHCWNILKFHPKWLEGSSRKKSKNSKKASPATSSPSTPSSVHVEDENFTDETFAHLERPVGRKAQKERNRKGKDCMQEITPAAQFIEQYRVDKKEIQRERVEQFQKALVVQQEMLELQKQKLRLKEQKEEKRIMATDTTNMDPMEAQYYELLKREIMEKKLASFRP